MTLDFRATPVPAPTDPSSAWRRRAVVRRAERAAMPPPPPTVERRVGREALAFATAIALLVPLLAGLAAGFGPMPCLAAGVALGAATYLLLRWRLLHTLHHAQGTLLHEATHDALTGLPNRLLFMRRLGEAMARAQPGRGFMAVMFMDLDNFKGINDSRGHEAGDAVLRHVADALRDALPQLTGAGTAGAIGAAATPLPGRPWPGYTIARLGGDEFTVIVEGLADETAIGRIAEGILRRLRQPVVIGGEPLVVQGSLGIAVYPQPSLDLDGLLRQADMALYRAKARGRNTLHFFDETMARTVRERIAFDRALREALAHHEFRLLYQPCVALDDGAVVGATALLHWLRPGQGLLPPEDFAAALDDGQLGPQLSPQLSDWLLSSACRQLADWDRSGCSVPVLALPLSRRQWLDPRLPRHVAAALDAHGIRPSRLRFDIAEAAFADRSAACRDALNGLALLGVGLGVSAYGTAPSALGSLLRPGLRALRPDRALVRALPHDADSRALLAALAALAGSLQLALVCDGVDSAEQAACLQALGCAQAQGAAIGPPLAGDEWPARAGRHGWPAAVVLPAAA